MNQCLRGILDYWRLVLVTGQGQTTALCRCASGGMLNKVDCKVPVSEIEAPILRAVCWKSQPEGMVQGVFTRQLPFPVYR